MIGKMPLPMVLHDAALLDTRELDDAPGVMTEEEFRAFYDRTARPLWGYLARITGDRQQADDVLQEAYYRFYRLAATYESEAHRRNSLFRIATNVVRDLARRAKYRILVEYNDELPVERPTTEHRVTARTDLSRAMQHLEPLQREMLWLAYVQGASHEEIAGMLGLRAVSIRTLLLRARRKLAAILTGGSR